jgi:hypothetical protein
LPYQFLTSGRYTVWTIINGGGGRQIIAVYSNTAAIGNLEPAGVNQISERFAGKGFVVTFFRLNGTIGPLNFTWFTGNGAGGPAPGDTALPGVDYTASSGSTGFANGQIGNGNLNGSPIAGFVPIIQTGKIINQFFTFTIQITTPGAFFDPTIYPPGTTKITFTVTIIRDGRGQLDFVGTPYSVQRPGGVTTVTLQVQRFNGFNGPVGCSFHTTDGTAIAGVAYTANSGTLSWADGDGAPKNITITILNGGAGTQNFTVTIDTPTGGVSIGATNVATVNITPGVPPANPSAGGSIPQQLGDVILPKGDGTFWFRNELVAEALVGQWQNNLTLTGILNNKIGGFIGFGPVNPSYGNGIGGGTDGVDQTPSYIPRPIFKYAGYQN